MKRLAEVALAMVRPLGAQKFREETKEKGLVGREYEMPFPHFPFSPASRPRQ